jgi:hypothetical protein
MGRSQSTTCNNDGLDRCFAIVGRYAQAEVLRPWLLGVEKRLQMNRLQAEADLPAAGVCLRLVFRRTLLILRLPMKSQQQVRQSKAKVTTGRQPRRTRNHAHRSTSMLWAIRADAKRQVSALS